LLAPFVEERINSVNALLIAATRGLNVTERRTARAAAGYPNRVTLRIDSNQSRGTVLQDEPRVTEIGAFRVDLVPEGRFLISRHQDRPGVVGQVGTILGAHDINIASMQIGRDAPRANAMMILAVDDAVPAEVQEKVRGVPAMADLRYVELGSAE
jgi:D-3-phosphoglycerate dehydrogenase